jgi:hypothetical protein
MSMRTTRGLAAAIALFGALAAWGSSTAALAQGSGHLRGTVASFDGRALTVKTASGDVARVTLAENARVFVVTPADRSRIAVGKFIGVTSVELGGRRIAREVHVFDDSLRGLGEGHYPWDLLREPNMMTNAAVAQVAAAPGGDEVELKYADGTQRIVLPPDVVVVDFHPAAPDRLAAGREVFLIANKQDDGTYLAPAVVVGDGITPPM